jgi:hypothetical protein
MLTKIVIALTALIFVGTASEALAKSRAPAKASLHMTAAEKSRAPARANPHIYTADDRTLFEKHAPYGY